MTKRNTTNDRFVVVPDPTRKGWWRVERVTPDELTMPIWARFRSKLKAEQEANRLQAKARS